MSTTNHITACSPWSAYRDHRGAWYVRSSTGQFLATMATGNSRLDRTHARLMAAAPQLLIALEGLLLTTELNLDELESGTLDAVALSKDAIACVGRPSDYSLCTRLVKVACDLLRALEYVNQWSITSRDDDFPYPVVETALKKARGR